MMSTPFPRLSFSTLARLTIAVGASLLVGCSEPPAEIPVSQRLVDVFDVAMVTDSPSPEAGVPEPTVFRFDEQVPEPLSAHSATGGWEAVQGVSGLSVTDGLLRGTTTSGFSLLRLERTEGLDQEDPLYEVEVRMRASAGGEIQMHFYGAEPKDIDRGLLSGAELPLPITTALEPSDEIETFRLRPEVTLRGAGVHHVLLRPTDVAGASFEIESVRLVFRAEHLASIPSGIGWQGLSEVGREVVVSRSPETIRWPLTLPSRPQLELALGTVDERPVTFRVALEATGESEVAVFERTVSTARRWELADRDLEAWGGREVTLSLTLEAEDAGTLGLWGAPAVRDRGGRPQTVSAADAPPRGVIFILADTLRPDRLEAFGHDRDTAPTVTALADQGARFADAIAQGTWTKVSAPSIFTSRYLSSTGVKDFTDRLPATVTTLAEVYREAGYATVGFSSLAFTGKANNLHQGYEVLHERTFDPKQSQTSRAYVDSVLPWLDRHQDVPFFVFLHFFDPHDPYQPAPPWDSRWAEAGWRDEHERQREKVRESIEHPLLKIVGMATRSEILAAGVDAEVYVGRELDYYDGSIRAMDVEIRRVVQRLRELGLLDDTLLVFVSDHGEEFLDHDRSFHAQSVYSELTHVPMILRHPPTVPAGTVVEETVQLIDLMPTMLELSGLEAPEGVQGQSALPLLRPSPDRRWQPRPAISEKPKATSPFVPPPIETESTALVFDGWKLIHNTERDEGKPEFELYDHRRDPRDLDDVAAQNPEVVERLATMMESWRQVAESERLESESTSIEDMSPEELERLKALGYVQ